ncbi:hypothetical protein [Gelidibacter maritimus]|uniref:Uncharacterized protein n=1 Tax=Gelidibacter maritimus TaxID=2761487 RepID=A0A7W2M3U0_9FLAO|nr:hypothetical protein [Gelidibacter maritimus]MBA6152147.1 hypothetical protein [Gelidibacter maritimus]
MKKIFSVLALILFMGSALNATAYSQQADCNSLAIAVANVYENAGYTHYEAWQAGNWAYDGCVGNGGSAGDSLVTIN